MDGRPWAARYPKDPEQWNNQLWRLHNLYYITSEDWNLHALRAVLMSGIAHLFVAVYSTVMRGGFLRFQAQYLRRIRIPLWKDVSNSLRQRLIEAGTSGKLAACDAAVTELYGLNPRERSAIGSHSKVLGTNVD